MDESSQYSKYHWYSFGFDSGLSVNMQASVSPQGAAGRFNRKIICYPHIITRLIILLLRNPDKQVAWPPAKTGFLEQSVPKKQ